MSVLLIGFLVALAVSLVSHSTGQSIALDEAKYNYAEGLHLSFLFYHAQRSGNLTGSRRLAWRSDSCLECKGPNGEDLSGGYYEAANTMKWGFPLTFTIYQLAWNIYEFWDGMTAVNELNEALDGLKWGSDYLIQCHPEPFKFYGMFGNSNKDFKYFGPPEEYHLWDTEPRPAFALSPDDPGTEIVAQAAAALAATAAVFSKFDAEYSQLCLEHAQSLYTFATLHQGSFMNSSQSGYINHIEWYASYTGYMDEVGLAALWLYLATNETSYLKDAESSFSGDPGWAYSWDSKEPALSILLARATQKPMYHTAALSYLESWMPGDRRSIIHTPKGLGYPYHWGANRYSANTAFLCFVYADLLTTTGSNTDSGLPARLLEYGTSLINYMLGEGGRSWVVGFGEQFPLLPYHKSSYNAYIDYPTRDLLDYQQLEDFLYSSTPNRFILYGALVGGPFANDSWLDNRKDYEYTEVTQDYNAAFTGALAFLVRYYNITTPVTDEYLDLGWGHPNADAKPGYSPHNYYLSSTASHSETQESTVTSTTDSSGISAETTIQGTTSLAGDPVTSDGPSLTTLQGNGRTLDTAASDSTPPLSKLIQALCFLWVCSLVH